MGTVRAEAIDVVRRIIDITTRFQESGRPIQELPQVLEENGLRDEVEEAMGLGLEEYLAEQKSILLSLQTSHQW